MKFSSEEKKKRQEKVEELKRVQPFKNPDIASFYSKHLDFEQSNRPFISITNMDDHDAICGLLLQLDRHGEEPLSIGIKAEVPTTETTTLCKHTLDVADILIRSVQKDSYKFHYFNLATGGMAALTLNLGLGFGADFCRKFPDLYQASIAIIEQIPAINSIYLVEEVKEVVRLFSMALPGHHHTQAKYTFEKSDANSNLAKLLVRAEMQVRRKEIFSHAPTPDGSCGVEIDATAGTTTRSMQYYETSRQLMDEMNLKLALKNQAKNAEIRDLVAKVKTTQQLTVENKLQKNLINAYMCKNGEAILAAEKKLEDFRRKNPEN